MRKSNRVSLALIGLAAVIAFGQFAIAKVSHGPPLLWTIGIVIALFLTGCWFYEDEN